MVSRIDVLAESLNPQMLEREVSCFANPADLIGGIEEREQIDTFWVRQHFSRS